MHTFVKDCRRLLGSAYIKHTRPMPNVALIYIKTLKHRKHRAYEYFYDKQFIRSIICNKVTAHLNEANLLSAKGGPRTAAPES